MLYVNYIFNILFYSINSININKKKENSNFYGAILAYSKSCLTVGFTVGTVGESFLPLAGVKILAYPVLPTNTRNQHSRPRNSVNQISRFGQPYAGVALFCFGG